jgi:hypothetical protein
MKVLFCAKGDASAERASTSYPPCLDLVAVIQWNNDRDQARPREYHHIYRGVGFGQTVALHEIERLEAAPNVQ